MARRSIFASLLLATCLAGCLTPSKDYHGYIADEAQPSEIKPGEDTRNTVLAQLGSPSTESIFDDNTWVYMTAVRERLAFMIPETSERRVTAIRFNDADVVDEVLEYTIEDGQVIRYAQAETATRGRELGLLEQLFGNVGSVPLPNSEERTPGDPTGSGRN